MNSQLVTAVHRTRGFTLVELMIVVAIVGILASVAVPSYLSHVRKGRRSDAVALLQAAQLAQEKWRLSNATYTGTNANLAGACLNSTCASQSGYYTLAISGASASAYILTASAVSGKSQAADSGCTSLVVTLNNGVVSTTPPACWAK